MTCAASPATFLPPGACSLAVLEVEGRSDKLVAYPLGDFTAGSGNKLVLDVDREKLRQKKVFDEDAWPAWQDPYWASLMAPGAGASAGASAQGMQLVRAEELIDKDIRHRNGEEAGEIEELIVDMKSGTVKHVIFDIEDSEREARIPIDALAMDAASGRIVLNMDREQLLQSPR